MVAGLSSRDGYSQMNPLSVFFASLVLALFKVMILHVHKEMTDSLNLVDCANDFVGNSEHCLRIMIIN